GVDPVRGRGNAARRHHLDVVRTLAQLVTGSRADRVDPVGDAAEARAVVGVLLAVWPGPRPSPCPPVWLSALPQKAIRGPASRPSRCALASPKSAPEASRTVVKPRCSMSRRLVAACAVT